ncbi:MAG: hypothetical protein AAFP82_05715 [Bacteroidota bacterium]
MKIRPIYVIAHRCNDPDIIQEAVLSGANAIECDVRFGNLPFGDEQWFVDHDLIQPFSVKLSDWMVKAVEVANNDERFVLAIFDIKTGNKAQVKALKDLVRAHFPANFKCIFSFGEFDSRSNFDDIKGDLSSLDGLAIDFDNDPKKIQDYFTGEGVNNFWYGNGINAATPDALAPNVKPSIINACQIRDTEKKIKGVYVWTLEQTDAIKEYLEEIGVDGVMVNRDGNGVDSSLKPVTKANEIIAANTTLRMATRLDNPSSSETSIGLTAAKRIHFPHHQ